MKKIFLLFILISGFVFGQFKVTESSADYKLVGKHWETIKLYQKEGKAKLEYLDINAVLASPSIFAPVPTYTFEFVTDGDTLNKIYEIIIEHFATKKVEQITLEFPEGNMYLSFAKGLGSYGFHFKFDKTNFTADKSSTLKLESYAMAEKHVKKLFGKK